MMLTPLDNLFQHWFVDLNIDVNSLNDQMGNGLGELNLHLEWEPQYPQPSLQDHPSCSWWAWNAQRPYDLQEISKLHAHSLCAANILTNVDWDTVIADKRDHVGTLFGHCGSVSAYLYLKDVWCWKMNCEGCGRTVGTLNTQYTLVNLDVSKVEEDDGRWMCK
jgi:hypothetical protein